MSAKEEEEEEQLGLEESTQLISDITIEIMTIQDNLQLLHIHDYNNSHSSTFSSLPKQLQVDSSKDVSKNTHFPECESAKKEEEDDQEHKLSTPAKKKLVSALKGSREKEGILTKGKELSVTWAPDVYDPLPSAAQTYIWIKKLRPKKKKNHEEYKKNGKYKHRGKVDKGGSSGSSSSKSKNKSMKLNQKQGGGDDNDRMWWQPLEEIYDD
ncbi:uncharacterized protein LOC124931915 [Impatiens glandulifera]|uniref:uncharacterized protein LOC124931915 n=1 Tax=Impatiens glandulifera TaxID=253017 RepID=UPI001FB06EBC|nr:uncharacterized protein LOC124931915 [Impatiens glandulifera]